MPIALSIQPFSDVLDMYGDADSSSTFSLSGHVSVSLTSPRSLFVRRKATTRILLRSLTITFEGQSETLSPGTGYAAVRLCSITRDILPGGPVEISNEGYEDSNNHCLWGIVFDLAVPGWLPTTSVYGDASLQATGTSYALYATATFSGIGHSKSPLSFMNICGTVNSRTRTVDAQRCPIHLRRFIEPQSEPSSDTFPMSMYIVDARREPDSEGFSRRSIPEEILEKIQVIASVPSAIAVDEVSLPFVLRVRGVDLDDSERKQLRITEFSVDVEQAEVYRKSLDNADQFPIPSQAYQPSHIPLRNPHPIHTLYDTGFLGSFRSSIRRSFSILAPAESGRYIISGDGRIFDGGHSSSSEDNWYILEAAVPIFTEPYLHDWAGMQKRRITESSPLFSVEHCMHVAICCEYDLADETVSERLHFNLPMRHVNANLTVTGQREAVQKNFPYTHSLPAYSQLFHPNGERKLDYSIPLPLYEPPSVSSSSKFATDQDMTL